MALGLLAVAVAVAVATEANVDAMAGFQKGVVPPADVCCGLVLVLVLVGCDCHC
jgi:hypothetical protein